MSTERKETVGFAVRAYDANTGRLLQLKRLFDPQGVFTSAISLPLQRAA